MHLSLAAAVLILGVLFLATTSAGRKVLAVLFVVGGTGLGYVSYVSDQEWKASAAVEANRQAHLPEIRAKCEKLWPLDPSEGQYSALNKRLMDYRSYCEKHPD